MDIIWNFTYMVLLALGMFFTGVYYKRVVAFYKRLITRKKRKYVWHNHQLELEQILELIDKRIELLNKQNSVFHDRMDEFEKTQKRRETRRKSYVKQSVLDYLKQLQK